MSEDKEQKEAFQTDAQATDETPASDTTQETTEQTDNSAETPAPTEADQIALLNDKYLRLYSEFDNYRKRSNKEKLELISTASAGVLKDLISVMDDFDRGIANNIKVDDVAILKDGFALIHTKLKSTLESKGLKQMVSKGEVFNADLHEAIANVPAPTPDLIGKIIDDVEPGYYLNEKVIRYAKVVVGQ